MEQSVLEGRKKISRSSSHAVELVKWNDESWVCETLLSSVWCCPFLRKEIDPPFFFLSHYRLNIVQLVWELKEIDSKWTGKTRLFKVFDLLTCCWEIVSNSFVSTVQYTLVFSFSISGKANGNWNIHKTKTDEVTWEQGRALRRNFSDRHRHDFTFENNNSNQNTGPPYI